MKTFDVRVKTTAGYDTLRISAQTISEAKEKASSMGRVLSAKAAKGQIMSKGLKPRDRIFLLRRIANLTKSRNSLANTLDVISETFGGKIADVSKSLSAKMNDGINIIDALRSMPQHFPSTTIALIKSEIHVNGISSAFKSAADFEEEMLEIGSNAKSGIMSAAFQVILGVVTILGTVFGLIPWMMGGSMMSMVEESKLADQMIVVADIHGYAVLIFVIISLTVFAVATLFKPVMPNLSDKIILRLPLFKDIALAKSYHVVFRTLSLLVKSNIGIKESFEIASESAPKGAIKSDIMAAIRAVEEGRSWAEEMDNISRSDRACLMTAESKSDISESFLDISENHKEMYIYRIRQIIPYMHGFGLYLNTVGMGLMFVVSMLPLQATNFI